MTATEVDGVEVVASEPALSGAHNVHTGEPLKFRQVVRLLLADGTELFGCIHCDYTAKSSHSVRPHLQKHSARRLTGLDVDQLVKRLAHAERVQAERDHWRDRARKAEGELGRIRKALSALGIVIGDGAGK